MTACWPPTTLPEKWKFGGGGGGVVEPPFEPQPAITISATAEQRMLEVPVWVLILLVAAWDTRLIDSRFTCRSGSCERAGICEPAHNRHWRHSRSAPAQGSDSPASHHTRRYRPAREGGRLPRE